MACYRPNCTKTVEYRCNCVSSNPDYGLSHDTIKKSEETLYMCKDHLFDHISIKEHHHDIQPISKISQKMQRSALDLLNEEISKIQQLKQESLSIFTQLFSSLEDLLTKILQVLDKNLQTKEQMINKVIAAESISNLKDDRLLRSLLSEDLSEVKKLCLFDEKTLKNVNALKLWAKETNEKIIRLNINKSSDIESNDIEILIPQLFGGDLKIIQKQLKKAQVSINSEKYSENLANILCSEVKEIIERSGPFRYPGAIWKGPMLFPNGCVYLGEWNDKEQPEGRGTMHYTDGSICEGIWKAGKLHGKGRIIYANEQFYMGDCVNDKPEGFGMQIYPDGSKFEGNYRDGKKNGKGKFVWTDGRYYEGDWVNNNQEGVGKCVWTDGRSYEGEWVNNLQEGVGKYVWSDGTEYKGEWKKNNRNGKGKMKWTDGREYDGHYVNGKMEGYGIFRWPSGNRYEGFWLNDKQHGEGTIFYKSGKIEKRAWNNGEKV